MRYLVLLTPHFLLERKLNALKYLEPGLLKYLKLPHLGEDGTFLLFGEIRSERDNVYLLNIPNRGVVKERNLIDFVLWYSFNNPCCPEGPIHVLGEYYIFEAEFEGSVH